MSKQTELLRARRFLPLLLTQTTGAFNDNLFKSAFIMLITYGAAAGPDPGAVAGGVAIAIAWGLAACCLLLLLCAAFGFAASLRVPVAPAPAPSLRLSWNLAAATAGILRQAWERREVRLSILGASWFWLVGAVSLSQLPSFAKMTLGADSSVVVLFLAAFSIGVGVGSSLCGRLMHGEVSARYVPLAALGMTVFSFDLGLAAQAAAPAQTALIGVVDFLSQLGGLRIFGDLLGLAVSGGFFVVPLYAIIQNRSEERSRARIIAANNVVNALFMAGAAAVTAGLIAAGLDTPALFLILGVANVPVTVWLCKLLPRDILLVLARTLFRLAYRIEVTGIENVAAAGDR